MCEKYTFRERAKLNVPIKVYGGKTDSGVTESELLAWDYVTDAFGGAAMFDGGHFYFRNSKESFLRQFNSDLEEIVKKIRLRESSSIFFSKPNL
jgi:surfactin synthase thioesterase subunit